MGKMPFWGTLCGRGELIGRGGSKRSGVETHCASWDGAIRCKAYIGENDVDCVHISFVKWYGNGDDVVLYNGPIGKFNPACLGETIRGLMQ